MKFKLTPNFCNTRKFVLLGFTSEREGVRKFIRKIK
jgi:hypothetical protein